MCCWIICWVLNITNVRSLKLMQSNQPKHEAVCLIYPFWSLADALRPRTTLMCISACPWHPAWHVAVKLALLAQAKPSTGHYNPPATLIRYLSTEMCVHLAWWTGDCLFLPLPCSYHFLLPQGVARLSSATPWWSTSFREQGGNVCHHVLLHFNEICHWCLRS